MSSSGHGWLVASLSCGALVAAGAVAGPRAPLPRDAPAPAPDTVVVAETPENLRVAFTRAMNAREWYREASGVAVREGHTGVARLFLACSRAQQAEADRHVQAIAWSGGEARAVLDRVTVGTTEDNLREAIAREAFEVETFYPALLARARADRAAMAVRSFAYARATDRGHRALLESALAGLASRESADAFFVCPVCGRTVRVVNFRTCPTCFGPAGRYVKVS
jgi:rubrerythrin